MPHDRAHRPDPNSGQRSVSSGASDRGHGNTADGRLAARHPAQSGGTYFLGRYRVVDEIGIGGMASVHLARMDGPGGFQKWVAIKKIHPHLVEDESFVQMFLDEARVAARHLAPQRRARCSTSASTTTRTGSRWSTSTASRSAR